MTSAQIAAGALADVDVLLVPNGVSTVASNALGPAGRPALIDWVNGGGRYVGWRGGAELAARLGITTALLASRSRTSPARSSGSRSTRRARWPPVSARSTGSSTTTTSSCGHRTPATSPLASPRRRPGLLRLRLRPRRGGAGGHGGGDRRAGRRRKRRLFLHRPELPRLDRRDAEDALERGARGCRSAAVAARAPGRRPARQRARSQAAAATIAALESPLRISVNPTSADAGALLGRYGASYTLRHRHKATFLIANPGGLTGDDHPFAATLAGELLAAGVRVIAYRAP